jgi:hypothetical protein
MRLFALLLAAFAAQAAAAQGFPPAVRRYIQTELQPFARAYERCAEQHLRARAAAAPHSTFESQEPSLRTTCGHYIRTIINSVINVGQSEAAAVNLVNDYYGHVQPKLRNAFETQAALRRSELEIAAAREREWQHISAWQKKLVDEEVATLERCLKDKLFDFAVFSNEKAETLADAVITSCLGHYEKIRDLLAPISGSNDDLEASVRNRLADDRRHLVANVIAIRAEVVKRAIQGPRPGEPTPPPAGEGKLY